VSARPPGDAATPAERRLDEHLEALRAGAPEPGRMLVKRVVRTARWQRAVRAPLRVVAMIAGAVLDGLAGLAGGRRRSR
jgi:hypothetical protein